MENIAPVRGMRRRPAARQSSEGSYATGRWLRDKWPDILWQEQHRRANEHSQSTQEDMMNAVKPSARMAR